MISPERILENYWHQGYNYQDWAPDKSKPLGGGCQAASLLMAIRLASKNKDFSMVDISNSAQILGLQFQDPKYATRISYGSVPLIASYMLSNCEVRLYNCDTLEVIKNNSETPINFYADETNQLYLKMHKDYNFEPYFGFNLDLQLNEIKNTIRDKGLAIPMVHTNTLYQIDDPSTSEFWHAIVVFDYNTTTDMFKVIDPNPGFLYMPIYRELKQKGKLKIRSNSIKNTHTLQGIAEKYHPRKSIIFDIGESNLLQALREATTTITPK